MNHASLRFNAVLDCLDALLAQASLTTDYNQKELILSYVVIKLHDQWNYRCRQIVHQHYEHSASNMMAVLRQTWGIRPMDKGWEPHWHMPSEAIRAARLLNISNFTKVQNALGAVTYVDDIRWTRNAIVHNIPASFTKYRRMVLDKYLLKNITPYFLPLERNPHTGNSIYEDWCSDLKNALRFAF